MQGNTQLQEVVIVSDKTETGTIATQMGSIEIPMTQIKILRAYWERQM